MWSGFIFLNLFGAEIKLLQWYLKPIYITNIRSSLYYIITLLYDENLKLDPKKSPNPG